MAVFQPWLITWPHNARMATCPWCTKRSRYVAVFNNLAMIIHERPMMESQITDNFTVCSTNKEDISAPHKGPVMRKGTWRHPCHAWTDQHFSVRQDVFFNNKLWVSKLLEKCIPRSLCRRTGTLFTNGLCVHNPNIVKNCPHFHFDDPIKSRDLFY